MFLAAVHLNRADCFAIEKLIGVNLICIDKLVLSPLPPPPSNFIAGRPKAGLLFWFFGDFRCGVPLFFVILVIYTFKNR